MTSATPLQSRMGGPALPVVAPDVRLLGQMQDSGYQEHHFLLEVRGQFIQLPEVLYRVLESADGQTSIDEIAGRVTAKTDWAVSAEDVQNLIELKLVPRGLVTTDASRASAPAQHAQKQVSPLAVYMRMRTLSAEAIQPIARALEFLHRPSVVVPALIAAAATHVWLYRFHGVLPSISDAVYTPGGLLIVIALVFLAAFFHEFGHASALQYEGGKVRGMGAGLYLLYPALYTDVTDAYRLGRRARVRVDLGGVYFHCLFSLALIALSVLLHRELLLFAVVLIDIDIVRQFIPFVRLDGYWLVADLTGIPDPFSQVVPFVLSHVRVPGLPRPKAPALKLWVKAVFVAYIALTIPILSYLFFITVRGVPTFLATSWTAISVQAHAFVTCVETAAYLTACLLAVTMLLITLTVVGTFYIIATVSLPALRFAWKWSQPSAARRAIAVSALASLAFGTFLLWSPQLYKLTRIIHPFDRSIAILQDSAEATAQVGTLRADLEGSINRDFFTGSVLLQRPNLARIEIFGKGGLGRFIVVSDGTKLVTYFPDTNEYTESKPAKDGSNIATFIAEPVDYLFKPNAISDLLKKQPRFTGTEIGADGVRYDQIELVIPGHGTARYFVSSSDKLIFGHFTPTVNADGTAGSNWAHLKNVRVNQAIDRKQFKFTRPEGASPVQLPGGLALPLGGVPQQH